MVSKNTKEPEQIRMKVSSFVVRLSCLPPALAAIVRVMHFVRAVSFNRILTLVVKGFYFL